MRAWYKRDMTTNRFEMNALSTARLDLQPLLVSHADAMFEVLSDEKLYRYLDYPPHSSLQHTRDIYKRLEARESPDGRQRWLNWIVVPRGQQPAGFVQATVAQPQTAWIAYLLGQAQWGKGYATEAVAAMMAHLADHYDVTRYLATVEAENTKIRQRRFYEKHHAKRKAKSP